MDDLAIIAVLGGLGLFVFALTQGGTVAQAFPALVIAGWGIWYIYDDLSG